VLDRRALVSNSVNRASDRSSRSTAGFYSCPADFASSLAHFDRRALLFRRAAFFTPADSPSPRRTLLQTLLAWASLGLAIAAGCGACNSLYYNFVIGSVPYTSRKHRGLLLGRHLEFLNERQEVMIHIIGCVSPL
jgi:hypothetical protein